MDLHTHYELQDLNVRFNVLLKDYTFTKTGGRADILALPKSNCEIVALVNYCREKQLNWTIIGHGSNLIIKDGGIRGVVISLSEMKGISVQSKKTIVATAGAKLIDVSRKALEEKLTGLEFACGIPGSVGGAVFMNAGAYGSEIKDVLISAEIIFANGTIKTLSNTELRLSYRHSGIEEMNCIVLRATFSLEHEKYNVIKKKMIELNELRQSKQPLEYPSCGSVFKRPNKHFAGKLIQDSGLQGFIRGGVQVSKKHAGFMVNIDHATATDYVELIEYVRRKVQEKFGIGLENEVRIIGED